MRRIYRIMAFYFLFLPGLYAADTIQVRIALFQGTWTQSPPRRMDIKILSAFTNPELSILKGKITAPGKELRAAVIEALMEGGDLGEIDDLFVMDKSWVEGTPGIWDSVISRQLAYRIGMLLKKQDPDTVSIHVAIKKTKAGVLAEEKNRKVALRSASEATMDETKMEEIMDEKLLVMIDSPVIVRFPSKDGIDFLLIALTRKPVESEPKESEARGHVEFVPAPQMVRRVVPSYPDDLKKEGIGGELKLRITIGKDGKVEDIVVMKSVHPYLDYRAVVAFREGEFEPVVRNGKAVRAAFDYSYLFDPSSGPAMTLESPEAAGNRGELDRILMGCAEYCRKLRDAALYFVCQEAIDEIHYRLKPDIRHSDLYFTWSRILADYSNGGQLSLVTDVLIMDPNRTERNNYVCDYQLIRNAETIKEKRVILKENGRKTPDSAKLLEEKRFSILVPMTLPLRIFDRARQPLFDFRIQGESGINGRKAWALEAVSKSGSGEWIQKARIWVDRQSFQILKSEIEGVPIEGYEDVLSDSVRLNIQPDFQMTSEYGVERNGVMFPEKTEVQVKYRGFGRPILKLKSTFKYSKYKFFSVETDHEIIK